MAPLAAFQLLICINILPATAPHIEHALNTLKDAAKQWTWDDPEHSLNMLTSALGGLSADIIAPLSIGVLVTAVAAAALSYPVTLILLTYFFLYRLRRRAAMGNSLRPPRGQLDIPPEPPAGAHDAGEVVHYAIHSHTFVETDGIKLLVDGREAFPEMLRAIEDARQSVCMETYILRADRIGRRFAAALAAAAARGVKVRLLYDGVGAMGLPQSYVDELLKAGVQPANSTSEEAQAMVRAEYQRWGEVAKKAGIQPE